MGCTQTTVWTLALVLIGQTLRADSGLPVVHEEVDEIVVVQSLEDGYSKVYFFRDNAVLADRLLVDRMTWTVQDDKFVLSWEDYARTCAARVVESKKLSYLTVESVRPQQSAAVEWWWMCQNMRDLKQP